MTVRRLRYSPPSVPPKPIPAEQTLPGEPYQLVEDFVLNPDDFSPVSIPGGTILIHALGEDRTQKGDNRLLFIVLKEGRQTGHKLYLPWGTLLRPVELLIDWHYSIEELVT